MPTPLHPAPTPNPEVSSSPRRRTFSAADKIRLLEEADRCTQSGQLGAFLRREGLYSSHLTDWRRQRAAGGLAALQPQRPGRKPAADAAAREIQRLQHENERLADKLRKAEIIIEVQKKIATLLGDGQLTLRSDKP